MSNHGDCEQRALPGSLDEYVGAILSALPEDDEIARGPLASLGKLRCWQSERALPKAGESLCRWLDRECGGEKVKLSLVVGETRATYRVLRHQRRAGDRQMTMAATSDGAAGLRAVIGSVRSSGMALDRINIDGVVDEWPNVGEAVRGQNLIVVGTGEVNILSTFLHGLVNDLYFGERRWPPHPTSLGTQFNAGGKTYHRDPGKGVLGHYGVVALLRNPWDPDRRLLWVAGLTGFATSAGCYQVAANWDTHDEKARHAIGVVFRVDPRQDLSRVTPEAWLLWQGDRPAWEPAEAQPAPPHRDRSRRPPKRLPKGKVFIGHGRSLLWMVLKDFLHDDLNLPWDEFNRETSAGVSTAERINQMLCDSCLAFLILTAEDQHSDQRLHARENVIHEVGLFQGKLGFRRAIILLEEGCAEFSNITGLTQIRFPPGNLRAAFHAVRQVLERERLI